MTDGVSSSGKPLGGADTAGGAAAAWPFVEKILGLSAAASASLLAGAHIFEAMGYAPCELCLDQREAHWAALAVTLAGLVTALLFKARRVAAAAIGATALVYAVSAGLAFYHTGVEFKFWPGPATCSGGGGVDFDALDLTGSLAVPATGPACSEAAWRAFGISMAGYNFLVSAGLFALCMSGAISATRQARRVGVHGSVA